MLSTRIILTQTQNPSKSNQKPQPLIYLNPTSNIPKITNILRSNVYSSSWHNTSHPVGGAPEAIDADAD